MKPPGANESGVLLARAGDGDRDALGELFDRHRDRMLRIIRYRMDRRLAGRLDPADVLQDAYVDATTRIDEYLKQAKVEFLVWLRFITVQRLGMLHRAHLGAQARNVGREVSLYSGPLPQATSADLAAQLVGRQTSPSQASMRTEMKLRLEEALNAMDSVDREVLALRYFEQLSNREAAGVLGIKTSAASHRYVRALKRLRKLMDIT